MRIRKANIENRINALCFAFPLPKGYMYALERGDSGYSLAVVRADYQGGNFYDLPRIGSMAARAFYDYLGGILEGARLQDRINNLQPFTKQEGPTNVCPGDYSQSEQCGD